MQVTADVKCYYCGHVSGQISGPRRSSLKTNAFVPRQGYTKRAPRPGDQLRCERCNGPVFLEDVSSLSIGTVSAIPSPRRKASDQAKVKAA